MRATTIVSLPTGSSVHRRNNTMNNLSFEEAYNRLEETVRTLATGGATLEEATRLFEEGMRLARICHQYLGATELKITHLQRSFGEQMTFVPPDADQDGEDDDAQG